MKRIMLLERYVLTNMLDREYSKPLDKKLKALQKYIYSKIYDSRMLKEHLDFIKNTLQECAEQLDKVSKNTELQINYQTQSLTQEPGKDFVDVNPASSESELDYISNSMILKVLNLESQNFDTEDFTNESRFKKKLIISYFLPSRMERYLIESSKKQNKKEKIEGLKTILDYIVW